MTISNSEFDSIIGPDPRAAGSGGAYSQQYQEQILKYGIDPVKAADIYNVPAHDGTGVKIGIIALGGGWKPSDLTASLNRIGITDIPNIEVVSVDGTGNVFVNTGNLYSGKSSTVTLLSFETALDVYCVSAVVPKANIVIYRGVAHTPGYLAALNYAVNDQCDIIATSFSYDETVVTNQMLASFESIFQRAVSQGTTIFAATGDWGSQVAISDPIIGVTYPASSPSVIGVGGSYLTFDADGNFVSEEASSESNGGVSILFPAPSWQENLTYTTYPDNQIHPLNMRGVPDLVTPFGDYLLYFDGVLWVADGASASAPLMAGIAARYVGISGKRLGLLTRDHFYSNPTLFNSIVTADDTTSTNLGNDASYLSTGYSLTPGWNPMTGLGSIKGQALLEEVLDPPPPIDSPDGYAKYDLGTTFVKNSGAFKPLKGMWINNVDGTWHPVKTGWTCRSDGVWERIYPTPAGIFTPNLAAINATTYYKHNDDINNLLITNTGDYDLTINNITINDSVGNFITLSYTFPSLPTVLSPGQSTSLTTSIYGANVGTFSGNLSFTLYTGYLGYANTAIPVNVTVQPDYNGITTDITTVGNLFYFEGDSNSAVTQTITVTNTGNGKTLTIDDIVSQNDYIVVNSVPGPIGYNFLSKTVESASFTISPAILSEGVYQDYLTINSDATNNPAYTIPVTVNVKRASGRVALDTQGTYTWQVPDHVYYIQLLGVGSGAGGGTSISNDVVLQGGGGGGGGSGAYSYNSNLAVTPGETLTITIGNPGGPGDPFYYQVYPVSQPGWSTFMNSYGVWVQSGGSSPAGQYMSIFRPFVAPANGNYTISAQTAGDLNVVVNKTKVLTANSYSTTANTTVFLSQGTHRIQTLALNNATNIPAGYAVTIADASNNIIWTTRSLLDPRQGDDGEDTVITGSFGTITVAGGLAGQAAVNDYIPPPIPRSNSNKSSPNGNGSNDYSYGSLYGFADGEPTAPSDESAPSGDDGADGGGGGGGGDGGGGDG